MASQPDDPGRLQRWYLGLGIANILVAVAFVVAGIIKDRFMLILGLLWAIIGIVYLLRWRKGTSLMTRSRRKI